MKKLFTREFATNLFKLGFIVLVSILTIYFFRYGILDSKLFHLDNLSRLATILLGSVGVIFTFTGVVLYFSILYKNNFTGKLTLALNTFTFFLNHHEVDNPKTKSFLQKKGLELISNTYVYIRGGFKNLDLTDIDLSSILYANFMDTYSGVFARYFYYVDHVIDIIYESDLSTTERAQYYNMLKLNLSNRSIAPLLYIYYYRIDNTESTDMKTKLCKKIDESGLFDEKHLDEDFLISPKTDGIIFKNKLNEFI